MFNILGKPYVLRIIKGLAANISQMKAEMDWLLYLASKGVNVPFPLKTGKGELTLQIG